MMAFDSMTDAFSQANVVITKILEIFFVDLMIKDKGHIIYVFINMYPCRREEKKTKIKIFS